METLVNNSDSLAANGRMFFKHVDKQLTHEQKTPKGVRKLFEKPNKGIEIFLVDDDPLYLKGLELYISGNIGSLLINSFETGEECLQHMKLKPSIVVLDYFLNSKNPKASNGLNVLKQIKQFHPKTKVIMLSSQDSLNIAIDCIENGAYDYISKSHSSFIRINNIIKNITGDMEVTSGFFEILKYILLIILFLGVLALIISH